MFNKYRQPVDRAKLLTKLRELEDEWRAFEHRLREEEREIWQPNWSHGDALAERLSRVGYPQETIDALKTHLDIINRLLCGEPLSPAALRDLDQMDEADRAAGESAVKQLAAIVIRAICAVSELARPLLSSSVICKRWRTIPARPSSTWRSATARCLLASARLSNNDGRWQLLSEPHRPCRLRFIVGHSTSPNSCNYVPGL
jgi:hypothetical protein